jgi:hypothetical protein
MYRRATTELSARSRLPNSPLGRSRRTEKWGTPRSRGNSQIRSVSDRRSRHRIPAKSNRRQDRNHHFPNEVKPLERPAAALSRLPRAHRIHSTWPDRQDRALALPVSSPLTRSPPGHFERSRPTLFLPASLLRTLFHPALFCGMNRSACGERTAAPSLSLL